MSDASAPGLTIAAHTRHGWNLQRLGGIGVSLLALLFLLAFAHPFGNARLADSGRQLMSSAQIGKPALDVMQRACQSCHSERTSWPVYSHVAPVSWLVEKDVQEARQHWNMSRWNEYSLDEREHILSQIGPMVRNRQMPLPRYVFLHPEAKLSDADAELLYQWTRQERKRLKAGTRTTVQ